MLPLARVFTLTNDFHNTQVRLRPTRLHGRILLSHRQVTRARHILCGRLDCCCGDDICKSRGMRLVTITPTADGGAEITRRYPPHQKRRF